MFSGIIITYLVLAESCTMAKDFFPATKGNLTKITWAHAVNNQSLLNQTLSDSTIMMIEADIVLGKLNGEGDDIPIMGHPPANTSDISLENFLITIDNFNKLNSSLRKGVKLDFKTTKVFESAISIITKSYQGINYPFWINADILKGPIDPPWKPVDSTVFLSESKQFTGAVLSPGWRTNYGGNITNASYTNEQIDEMVTVLAANDITQDVTFPVRAGIAAESRSQMIKLIASVAKSTLTIWSSAGDAVNVPNLRNVIREVGVDKVYVDVPAELRNKLHLDEI